MNYLRIYDSKTGGAVELHPLHGADELPNNLQAAKIIADQGCLVELLPNLPGAEKQARKYWLPDVTENKNPDIRIDGIFIGDIKTPNPHVLVKKSTINHCIYSCARQKVSIAIINLMDRDYTLQDIKKGIIGALQPDRNKTIKEAWIITRHRNLFKVARNMVFDESIYETLHYL